MYVSRYTQAVYLINISVDEIVQVGTSLKAGLPDLSWYNKPNWEKTTSNDNKRTKWP
jgi:hypothetical protein